MLIDGGNSGGDYREPDLTPHSQSPECLAGTSTAGSWLLCRSSEPLLVWECVFRRYPGVFVQSHQPCSPKPGYEQLVQRDLNELQQARFGYLVEVVATAAMARNGSVKGDLANGGAKKLVLFGNASRVFDLEDLLRASQPTGYLAQESLSFLQKRTHC